MRNAVLLVVSLLCSYLISAQSTAIDSAANNGGSVDSVAAKPHYTTKQRFAQFGEMLRDPPKPAKKGKLYAFPIPLFSTSPTVNFLYGIGATGSWYVGDPKDTRISNAQIGVAYTIKNQSINTFRSSIYTPHDDFIVYGDWRFILSSQPGFALGTGPQTDILASNGARFNDNPYATQAANVQLLYFDDVRVYETVLRRVIKQLYMGIAYHLDYYFDINDKELNLKAPQPVTTNYYEYNIKNGFNQNSSLLSGVSANAVYDARDNQNNPYTGRYAFISFRYNPTFLGSNKNSSTLWVEYREFISFTHNHRNVLALWAFGDFVTTGSVPFFNLPAIGADQFGRSGEAYILGRFRGESLVFGEAEYRRHVFAIKNYPDFFGLALFANVTTAGAKESDIKLFQYFDPAFGGGIRINISRVPRSNLGIDYAVGFYGSQGLYLRFNETF